MTPNDVKIVADNISDFIEVPDGIERLRKAVLTLAVSGNLVPQDKNEGTGNELYKKIQIERSKKEDTWTGRKKNEKEVALISPEEIPFDIPKSWKWVRLGDVFLIERGGSPRPIESYITDDPDGLNWIKIGDTEQGGKYISSTKEKIIKSGLKKSRMVHAGDLLLTNSMSFGRPYILKIDGCIHDGWLVLRPYNDEIIRDLFYYSLSSPMFFQQFVGLVSGAVVKNLNAEKVRSAIIPLPPIAEQERIVKKVEEVMKQLDKLEAKKQEQDETRTRLARSSMQSLGKGEPKIAFDHLAELIKTPADLKEFEGALLTLAVSGQLVSQNKKDGTGEDLFNKIQSKKAKVKKQIIIEDKDKLFSIPSSWSWVRLEDAFDVRDGTHDSPKYHTSGYPLITSKNLYYGKLDFLNVKYVSEIDYKKINERSKVDRDDILFAMIGSIGNPAIVDTDVEFSIKNVALFKYYSRELSEPNFLLTYLKYASQNMRAVSAGGVQSFVSLGFLRGYPFPLPPLAEQKRIVKKVEEIMVLIDHLKQVIGEK